MRLVQVLRRTSVRAVLSPLPAGPEAQAYRLPGQGRVSHEFRQIRWMAGETRNATGSVHDLRLRYVDASK